MTQKIIELFRNRKNNTKKAMEDCRDICDWITNIIDNITVESTYSVSARITTKGDAQFGYDPEDHTSLRLEIRHGKCGFWLYMYNLDYVEHIDISEIDYINMPDLVQSIEYILNKLSETSDRKEVTEKIGSIRNLLLS